MPNFECFNFFSSVSVHMYNSHFHFCEQGIKLYIYKLGVAMSEHRHFNYMYMYMLQVMVAIVGATSLMKMTEGNFIYELLTRCPVAE